MTLTIYEPTPLPSSSFYCTPLNTNKERQNLTWMLIEHARFPLERRLRVLAAHQPPHLGRLGPGERRERTGPQICGRRHAAGQGGRPGSRHAGLIGTIVTAIITILVLLAVAVGRRVTFGVPAGAGRGVARRRTQHAGDGRGTSQREQVELGRRGVTLGRALRVGGGGGRVLAEAAALNRWGRYAGRGTVAGGHTRGRDGRGGGGLDRGSPLAAMALGRSLVLYVLWEERISLDCFKNYSKTVTRTRK